MKIVISDASCIIALEDIGELRILKELFNKVVVTDIVRSEVQTELPDWIIISKEYDQSELKILQLDVDKGEASAIALALKNMDSKIILDEKKGRILAKRLGLKVIGTLGLIVAAKQKGIISSGKTVLEKLEKHGFWLSEKVKHHILTKLNE